MVRQKPVKAGVILWVNLWVVAMGKLTGKTVEALAKTAEQGKTGDGAGLYFQISRAGVASWLFRYMLAGKSREMGLGPYPAVTLAKARELAADQRKLLATGNDPMAARDADQLSRSARRTKPCRDCAPW